MQKRVLARQLFVRNSKSRHTIYSLVIRHGRTDGWTSSSCNAFCFTFWRAPDKPIPSTNVSQTGFREVLLGVPRGENAYWRKSFIGGPKFVCTSVKMNDRF